MVPPAAPPWASGCREASLGAGGEEKKGRMCVKHRLGAADTICSLASFLGEIPKAVTCSEVTARDRGRRTAAAAFLAALKAVGKQDGDEQKPLSAG